MQPSSRQQELERLYNARKGHVPQISISDNDHHITEAIGSYYDDVPGQPLLQSLHPSIAQPEPRPLSYMNAPSEIYESRGTRRQGSYFEGSPTSPLSDTVEASNSRIGGSRSPPSPMSPNKITRMASLGHENGGHDSRPALSRQSSTDTAIQSFPLNDIDYESSPAAVAQELSNLQAIRRMSMSVDTADPDLPSFNGGFANAPPSPPLSEDDNDPARLFWVPARLHPELAPKEFKTFVEDRVEKIRRRSGGEDNLSSDGLERSSSVSSSLRRKKSMLSHTIDTKGNYEDGAERLDRKRSKGMSVDRQTPVSNLSELELLVNDPAQLISRMSLDTVRRSEDSGIQLPSADDMPILPQVSQSLKRSTRTTYRRGSLKKGERVPFSKRAHQRAVESSDMEPELPVQSSSVSSADGEAIPGLSRVLTESTTTPSVAGPREEYGSRSDSRRRQGEPTSQSSESPPSTQSRDLAPSPSHETLHPEEEEQAPPTPQHGESRQFQSRLASGGRTTAQLPGYNNANPLPHIIETLADGTKVPVGPLAQKYPERKSSHDLPRTVQRGGAHTRPVPGRQSAHPSSTLDDISSNPSPLPGSGSTRTDALTMVPTYEEKKIEKKDSSRKSSWKWILGNDDDEKEKKAAKEELAKAKSSKAAKAPGEKARLDVLQNSIDGTTPARGRESIVLNRDELKIEEEPRKNGKKSSETSRKEPKEKETGLLAAIFGGKKKSADAELKENKKRKSDRNRSMEPPPRILKPDIDYNWTRFSILEERAIYRMAHIKLANPRRALYSQVLLSNFMYSYLAKVQMMHPQMQIPSSQQKAPQQRKEEPQQQQPSEYSQYQRYQEVSDDEN